MDLLEMNLQNILHREAPLAVRMSPKNFEQFIGQEHIIGKDKLLRKAIEEDKLQSIILYGPSGSGKTALAKLISKATKSYFESLNAVMAGVADIKKIVDDAQKRRTMEGVKTIVFIDEIHRFNKNQQDALLPFVESGLMILIGATTENPMISVNKALLSRTRVFKLEPLTDEDMRKIVSNALKDQDNGLGRFDISIDDKAIEKLIKDASGDARFLLNALELAVMTTRPNSQNVRCVTLDIIADATQQRVIDYDTGQEHYDVISAFIKSMRGSDPHATVYWLARMLYAGEDPLFIARRMVICASEDVGLADSNALVIASAALDAVRNIGMPEARIILAHAATYIALAPKSNSTYMALGRALQTIEETKKLKVPIHLRDKHHNDNFGNEKEIEYKYPHDYPRAKVKQQYLPDEIKDKQFYQKTENDN